MEYTITHVSSYSGWEHFNWHIIKAVLIDSAKLSYFNLSMGLGPSQTRDFLLFLPLQFGQLEKGGESKIWIERIFHSLFSLHFLLVRSSGTQVLWRACSSFNFSTDSDLCCRAWVLNYEQIILLFKLNQDYMKVVKLN